MLGKLVIVEGNLSSGKSTLCGKLGKMLGMKVFLEPALDNPYLVRYYANPKKYALTMQLYLLRDRFKTYIEALTLVRQGKSVILDRSIFSDFVFATKNHKDGNISDEGFNYYLKVRSKMMLGLPLPDMLVYLNVPVKECHRRITEVRKRECEDGIPLDYLQGIEDAYKRMLKDMSSMKCNILNINWESFGKIKYVSDLMKKKSGGKKVKKFEKFKEVSKLIKNEREVLKRMQICWSNNELHFDDDEIEKDMEKWEKVSPMKKKR